MVRAKGFLRDCQRALEERLRPCVLSLGRVNHGKVVKARGYSRMVLPLVPLRDLQCSFRNDLGAVIFFFFIERDQLVVEIIPLAGSSLCGQDSQEEQRNHCNGFVSQQSSLGGGSGQVVTSI